MAIIFKNIDNGHTVAIDQATEGKFYGAKLSALVNSSNMSINADRGQDFGWRLDEEQQALIEAWEEDPAMIDRVAQHMKVPVDMLAHGDFLSYLLYQQSIGTSPERREMAIRRERQAEYAARVEALKKQKVPEAMPAFKAPTVDDFMSGALTGDASGDKVLEEHPESAKIREEREAAPTKTTKKK